MTPIYPDCPVVTRMVRIGGQTRQELLAALLAHGIELNDAGRALFARDEFTTSAAALLLETAQLSVANLGFPDGATSAEILDRAAVLGLSPCPLELGPHLRLAYRDQPEGHLGHQDTRHQAPPGSITIASRPIHPDDDVPKGFYLRRIDGALWLRGYRASPEHVWSPADQLVFVVRAHAGEPQGEGRPTP